MDNVLRSLLRLLGQIVSVLLYQADIPHQHKEDIALALKEFDESVEFYLSTEYLSD